MGSCEDYGFITGADWTPDDGDFMNCVYAGAFKYGEVVDVNP